MMSEIPFVKSIVSCEMSWKDLQSDKFKTINFPVSPLPFKQNQNFTLLQQENRTGTRWKIKINVYFLFFFFSSLYPETLKLTTYTAVLKF